MKIKSIYVAFVLLTLNIALLAQRDAVSFFEPNGIITQSPALTSDLSYTLAHLDYRANDIVWAHVTYSIIDLRDNNNAQLAFPQGQDAHFKNLFRLLCEAVTKRVPVYYPNEQEIAPNFVTTNIIPTERLADVFFIETTIAGAQYIDPLFELNPADGSIQISTRIYDRFARNIQRFLVQKVYYFNKHLSTMGSRIIAIAPLQSNFAQEIEITDDEEITDNGTQALGNTLRESIIGWFLYNDLRSHFSNQLVFQPTNVALRINYHEFFTKRMYTDYLIGDNYLFRRLFGHTETLTLTQMRSEIQRIQRELVEIESNLFAK